MISTGIRAQWWVEWVVAGRLVVNDGCWRRGLERAKEFLCEGFYGNLAIFVFFLIFLILMTWTKGVFGMPS